MLWKNERDRFGGEGRSERGYSGPLLTLTNVITLDGLRLGGVLQYVSVFKRKEPLYSGSCQVSSLASILLGKESSSAFVPVSLASPPARAHTAKAERQLASISRLALMSKTQLISKCFHYWYHIKEGVQRRIWVWYTFMCILFMWNTSPLSQPCVISHLLAYAGPAALELSSNGASIRCLRGVWKIVKDELQNVAGEQRARKKCDGNKSPELQKKV